MLKSDSLYPFNKIDDYINKDSFLLNDNLLFELEKSELLGRGGASYPTFKKVKSVLDEEAFPKYIICNADEGEPGNFKDKYLLENNPYIVIEGIILLAKLLEINEAYIYIREEYDLCKKRVEEALEETKKYQPNINIKLKFGAGSYLCGEEFALISSIE